MHVFVFESKSLIGDHRFSDETVVVGSAPECTIRLRDARIARQHLRLCPRAPGDWIAEPLDDTIIPHINGRRLAREHSLRELDEIALGPFILKFYFADGSRGAVDGATVAAAATDAPKPAETPDACVAMPLSRWNEWAALGARLAMTEDTASVFDEVVRAARHSFDAAIACLRLCGGTVTGRPLSYCINAGNESLGQPALASLLEESCTQRLQRVCLPAGQSAGSSAAMAVPVVGAEGQGLGMIYLEARPGSTFDTTELNMLSAFSSAVAPGLYRAMHPAPAAPMPRREDAVAAPGGVAQAVQEAIAPRGMPNWPGIQVALYRRPGTSNCCDLYDLLRLANGTAAFLMARVNAHGPALPRVLAETRAVFRTTSLHADAPHVFARALNWLLGDGPGGGTVDLGCVWLAPTTGVIKACFAGRSLFAGILPDGGEWSALPLPEQPAIGTSRGFAYGPHSAQLSPGDALVMGTCGIDQLRNADGDLFGRNKMLEILSELAGTSASVMLSDLATDLDQFAAGGDCPDDFSLLLARRE